MELEDDADDDIVRGYVEDRITVEGFLQSCRSYYEGDEPHFLLSRDPAGDGTVLRRCLQTVPEAKLCVLLDAILAESPRLRTYTNPRGGSLLHMVLRQQPTHRLVQLVLAVKECTRLLDVLLMTPLNVACSTRGVDPVVIQRLITLDPDVLTLPDRFSQIPLHRALERELLDTNAMSPHVRRMIELRTETLLFRNHSDFTPVAAALSVTRFGRRGAAVLGRLVEQHPRSVSLPDTNLRWMNPLMVACEYSFDSPELVRAVLEAHPVSLVVPSGCRGRPFIGLPFEVAATTDHGRWARQLEFVWDETVHMALAVVEYVLGAADLTDAGPAWFQMQVRNVIRQNAPAVLAAGMSSLSVAQALRDLDYIRNRNDSALVTLVRSLFCHDRSKELLQGESALLRHAVLCEAVVDLFRLNRLGRYRSMVSTPPTTTGDKSDKNGSDDIVLAARHQIELLASLRDSTTLESTYLQFREVSHHVLLVHERGRKRRRLA